VSLEPPDSDYREPFMAFKYEDGRVWIKNLVFGSEILMEGMTIEDAQLAAHEMNFIHAGIYDYVNRRMWGR